ncbi:hypothetical protein Bbelb_051700 [Branchiostoma belcheri]|nr:hypothetical protein Bbelb_051700 [Branchiostoma belcheri]
MSAIWVLSENLQLEEDGTEVVTTDLYILDVKTELKHVVESDKLAPQDRSGNVLRELFLAEKAYLQDEVNWGAGAMMQFQGPKPELGKPTCETRAEGNQGQASSFTQEASQGVERHFSYVTWQEYFKTKAAGSAPHPDNYFQNRMFLWAPMRMWKISLFYPKCNLQLTHAGLYPKAREVVDIDSRYYLIGLDYPRCSRYKLPYCPCSKDILQQLDLCHKNLFPAVLTKNAALDKKCVTLMKPRTLGNSSSYIHQAHLHSLVVCHLKRLAEEPICRQGKPLAGVGQTDGCCKPEVAIPTTTPCISWVQCIKKWGEMQDPWNPGKEICIDEK